MFTSAVSSSSSTTSSSSSWAGAGEVALLLDVILLLRTLTGPLRFWNSVGFGLEGSSAGSSSDVVGALEVVVLAGVVVVVVVEVIFAFRARWVVVVVETSSSSNSSSSYSTGSGVVVVGRFLRPAAAALARLGARVVGGGGGTSSSSSSSTSSSSSGGGVVVEVFGFLAEVFFGVDGGSPMASATLVGTGGRILGGGRLLPNSSARFPPAATAAPCGLWRRSPLPPWSREVKKDKQKQSFRILSRCVPFPFSGTSCFSINFQSSKPPKRLRFRTGGYEMR